MGCQIYTSSVLESIQKEYKILIVHSFVNPAKYYICQQKMTRPEIKIKLEPIDWLVEITGLLAIVLIVGLPAYYFGQLPDQIPGHYGIDGQVDRFDEKVSIWVLPLIAIFTYIGLAALNRFPHIFNYPKEITIENAERQYKIACRFIRFLNTIIACFFCYITYKTIFSALGRQNGLGHVFVYVFIALIALAIVFYFYQAKKNSKPLANSKD
jgi:uncharacterized membrane protein